MEVRVEEDQVDVTLQILEAPQEQRLARRLRLSAFNLKRKHRNIDECVACGQAWLLIEAGVE